MGIEHEEALALACHYDEMIRNRAKIDKSEAVRKLAAFGLFNASEIAQITGLSHPVVVKAWGEKYNNKNYPTRTWNINHLTTLFLVAQSYRAGIMHDGLIRKMTENGTSVRAIVELTGVPRDKVREAVLD